MSFPYKNKGIDPDSSQLVAPEGVYTLQIKTATDTSKEGHLLKTKNGDPYVKVKCEINNGEFKGTPVWHNITFLPAEKKGAGMAIKWLKTIGEPWEGEFDVMPDNWVGHIFKAKLIVDTYEGKSRNEISYLVNDALDEVPF